MATSDKALCGGLDHVSIDEILKQGGIRGENLLHVAWVSHSGTTNPLLSSEERVVAR